MKKKRHIIIGFIALIAVIIFVRHHHHAATVATDAVIVNAQPVSVGNIMHRAKAVGTLTALHNIDISPQIAGQVGKVLFQDGAFVKTGTPLIQLDDTVNKSKAISARANLFYSETNYKRMVLLGKQGVVAKQAIDQAQADLKQKQAEAAASEADLQQTLLTAPFDGRLGKANVSPGNYVTVGQSLVSLTDVNHLRVEYNLSEKYLPLLKVGQAISITTSNYPGKVFQGIVSFVSPTINTSDRTIALYADLDNAQQLLTPGLFVEVTQSLGQQNNVLLVPPESLIPTIDGQMIFKVENGKAISTPIVIGERTDKSVEVIKGLTAQDQVVTAGQDKLHDGSAVKIES